MNKFSFDINQKKKEIILRKNLNWIEENEQSKRNDIFNNT